MKSYLKQYSTKYKTLGPNKQKQNNLKKIIMTFIQAHPGLFHSVI